MIRHIRISLESFLLATIFSSCYFVLPNNASPKETSKHNIANMNVSKSIQVKKIEVVGNTVLTDEEITSVIKPLEGKLATLEQIQTAAESITQLYISKGYVTSRAEFQPDDHVNRVVQIKAIEGELERIDIIGNLQTSPDYVRSRVGLGLIKPFNANRMEEQLRICLLNTFYAADE